MCCQVGLLWNVRHSTFRLNLFFGFLHFFSYCLGRSYVRAPVAFIWQPAVMSVIKCAHWHSQTATAAHSFGLLIRLNVACFSSFNCRDYFPEYGGTTGTKLIGFSQRSSQLINALTFDWLIDLVSTQQSLQHSIAIDVAVRAGKCAFSHVLSVASFLLFLVSLESGVLLICFSSAGWHH